ncbi:MAG: triose-phosphate isomerase [Bacilli bacterium]|nr:triose-phosphate isomerase [Bacilli bacterium]
MKSLVLNHKMNFNYDEVNEYIKNINDVKSNKINLVICPSFIYLSFFKYNNYYLGSQNVGMMEKGALTGEISALQLKKIGVRYCIVGHSERRMLLNETNEMINKKINHLLDNNIIPILCVGETLEEKKASLTFDIIKEEIDRAFSNISNIDNIIIAYEPIWAIGTGMVPTNNDIFITIKEIKDYINGKYSTKLKVLYGGSVNSENINVLEDINNVDGYLVGGASLDFKQVKSMITAMEAKYDS